MTRTEPVDAREGSTKTCWGYSFKITSDHLDAQQLGHLRRSYDALGEESFRRLQQKLSASSQPSRTESLGRKRSDRAPFERESGQQDEKRARHREGIAREKKTESHHSVEHMVHQGPPSEETSRDLFVTLERHAQTDAVLSRLWNEAHAIPGWLDWAQIAEGQKLFYRYGEAILTGLLFNSLLGGMGGWRVVETLAKTGGFSTNAARRRLYETTQYLLQITRSLGSIQPGGDGFKASIRVRLLHAAVRCRILDLVAKDAAYYDISRFGMPINNLDCIGTICTFSATLIWVALPRQGIFLRPQEVEDYLALFRYVAYLNGTPDGFFASPSKARATMESLLMHDIAPSPTSRVLANNIIEALANQPPAYPSRALLEANARWLNGEELCDALGLSKPSAYYWLLMARKCLCFMVSSYVTRCVPYLDRQKIEALRRLLWLMIVEGKHGLRKESLFNFQYVPMLHKTTKQEMAPAAGRGHPAMILQLLSTVAAFGIVWVVLGLVLRS